MKKILFLFGELNDDDLDWIIATGNLEKLPVGTILIKEGEPIDYLYILLEGTVAVSVTVDDSSREIALSGSGEVFGEISFMDDLLPSASVEVVAESLVLSISRHQLFNRLHEDVGFASRFYRAIGLFLSSRLRSSLKERDYEKDYIPSEGLEEENCSPAFLDNLSLAETRFDWLLKRVRNLTQGEEH